MDPSGGKYGPVGWLQFRTVDLASEHRHFAAQDDDLGRKIGVLATDEPDQLEDANQRPA